MTQQRIAAVRSITLHADGSSTSICTDEHGAEFSTCSHLVNRWDAFTDDEVDALAGAMRERAFRSSLILHDNLARDLLAEQDRRQQA